MKTVLSVMALLLVGTGCTAMAEAPLVTVRHLDLERFMGRWYVIASIPTPFERGAFNAMEDYALTPEGTVATRFSYNKGGFDGPYKVTRTTGFVSAADPAIWGMQFVWPFKADYRVAYVDEDYGVTIVARQKRDYVWLMARVPGMDEAAYAANVARIEALGYDVDGLIRIQHASPASGVPADEAAAFSAGAGSTR